MEDLESAGKAISSKREAFMASIRKGDIQSLFESRRKKYMQDHQEEVFTVGKLEVAFMII